MHGEQLTGGDLTSSDLGFAAADINQIFLLFLSAELLKIKEDLIKGFPILGFVIGKVPHLVSLILAFFLLII